MMFVADDLGSLILKDVSGGSLTLAQIQDAKSHSLRTVREISEADLNT